MLGEYVLDGFFYHFRKGAFARDTCLREGALQLKFFVEEVFSLTTI
jgi:hypothetical protein